MIRALLALPLLACPPTAQEHPHVRQPLPTPEEIAELPPDGGPDWNRLVFEQSPYLLQHAGNPVDWHPWGEEAFELARELDRPVFLSIGYSTCHWCHVMEHESFEDEQVAKLMNDHFVCIKVDREERPDLDHVYMTVTQQLTGSGGWPMTVVMTPDAKPFFAGTYFPKEDRGGRRGMLSLVPGIYDVWMAKRDEVLKSADEITAHVARLTGSTPGDAPGVELLDSGVAMLSRRFDANEGGFGTAPKFPVPHNLVFLLQQHLRTGAPQLLAMVERTLVKMRNGGMFDHVGFGFHRYSTDPDWLLPHFEKMLYDQALMTLAYVSAWQVTGADTYRRTAEEVLTYVLRDMTAPEGGFYSAEDADSEGEEGLFYLWKPGEVVEVLGETEGDVFCRLFDIKEGGNFHDESTGRRTGDSIPHLRQPLEASAQEMGLEPGELAEKVEAMRAKLFAAREHRIHPLKDDKVLTDWNGLMIAAMARAGAAFDEPRYTTAAKRAADFALAHLRDEDGRLYKRWRGGQAALPGVLEDYAFLAWGLLELYEATFDARYVAETLALVEHMVAHFSDEEHGGFFLGADDGEPLFVRGKEIYDGAIPSGNSVAVLVLHRLARMTGDTRWEELAERTASAFAGEIARGPGGSTLLLQAVDFAVGPSYEIVVAGDPEAEDTRTMLRALRSRFLPNKVVLLRPPGDEPEIGKLAAFTIPQRSIDGKATAYVCRDFACELPTTDVEAMLDLIRSRRAADDD
jgi:uncharacterized protein YyaL (SSP411 family)